MTTHHVMFHLKRRLCRRTPLLGEVPDGAVETPSDLAP
jgi:hypothetical protein